MRRDFLDLFHHRILSLLYRGLARYDVPSCFRSDGADEHSLRLLAFSGIDARIAEVEVELLRIVPALVSGRGTAHGVEAAVIAFFATELEGAGVRLVPFVGGLEPFDDAQRMRLGVSATTLGIDSVLGSTVPHPASTARLVLGPLRLDAYRGFLPGGRAHPRLLSIVTLALDAPLDLELELVLREGERPPFALSGLASLGRDTFLGGGGGLASVRIRPSRTHHVRNEPSN